MHYTISYRSFKHFDEDNFISDLKAVPWDLIKVFDDPDDIRKAWTDLFLEVVDRHVPIQNTGLKGLRFVIVALPGRFSYLF